MSLAYVNGRFLPLSRAVLPVEDRATMFGDAVYEVVAIAYGKTIDLVGHLDRLERSLAAVRIKAPRSRIVLQLLIEKMIHLERLVHGLLYLQISRGTAKRDHPFPCCRANLFLTLRHGQAPSSSPQAISAVSIVDLRWRRVDIKTVNLLPNCLARQEALDRGAEDAILIEETTGQVREATASNVWLVNDEGTLVTPPATHSILRGITRDAVSSLILSCGLAWREDSFTLAEVYRARELFLTSSTGFVVPVVRLDDRLIASGAVGAVTRRLYEAYLLRMV